MSTPPQGGTVCPPLRVYPGCLMQGADRPSLAIQAAKTTALQNAYRKRELETPRDQAPSAGEIRSLGLLDRKDEEVDIKHGGLLPTFKSNAPK